MKITEEAQEAIDALFETWKQDDNPFAEGEEVGEGFEEVTLPLEEWATVEEELSWTLLPEKANRLLYDVSEERVAELADEAEPTDEEAQLWEDWVGNYSTYVEILSIYRLESSEGEVAWITLSVDGNHQGTQITDGSGPFYDLASMAQFLGKKVHAWDDYAYSSDSEEEETKQFGELLSASGSVR